MSHAERMESVKHCRWVDEIAPEAPWVVDQAWLERYQIDYVAHDEMVYPGGGHLDVYDFVKKQGEAAFLFFLFFLPFIVLLVSL